MNSILKKASCVVLEAGNIIKEGWKKPKNIKHKGRIDLVTETDLAVELFLKEELSKILPGSSFLAEETAGNAELVDRTWIIDPLDGTTNFAHGLPMVATSVALWIDDSIALGIINLPILNEIFTTVKGDGAFMNGETIHVSDCASMEDSLIATGFPYAIEDHVDFITKALNKVLMSTQGVRRPGAAALDLAYLACGRYDGFYENALRPWDTAAGWLLVEEAGGTVSDYNNGEFNLFSPGILATNSKLHDSLGNILRSCL
ncbi:myo-inositol-1(or 4)-monophosphatase [Maridesulfovibrio ferrireducens]|uniref:Inositol-1-monophosphatase n=1 Tax=Maridesulfovibrio ferrireducens TaxID=246191 RepID=A0A1G9I0P0_9BACT|nr:inositol monophosphatase family protein [Maridesulfovibrio ferrireducens]SDL18810.1 myo-inositol-1(or 4)-monophosphatase [Maridesulfovibrio ferrireducens]